MYDNPSRRLRPKDVAVLVKSSDFEEENRYAPPSGGGFIPWGKTSFKVISKDDIANANEAENAESASHDKAVAHAETEAAQIDAEATLAQAADQVTAMPPAPGPQDNVPSSEAIIAEIEKAREDGRVIGYQQGLTAGRQEFEAALDVLRRLEERIVPLADEAIAKNTEVIARHVRRIAQDLAGTVFAEIPEPFLERIRRSAELFVRANSEFSLFVSSPDLKALTNALKGEEIFADIKIVADPDLMRGAFRLSSRDLEVVDTPVIEGGEEDPS